MKRGQLVLKDGEISSLFFKVRPDAKADDVVDTVDLNDGIMADYDREGSIIGITVLYPATDEIKVIDLGKKYD